MIRRIHILLLCLIIIFISSILLPEGFPEPAPSSGKEITLSLWGVPEAQSFEGVRAAVAEFERRHPHIRVKIGSPGGTADIDPQKLLTAVAAGTPPDLILQDRFTISGWAARGAFLPLNDLVEQDNINKEDFYHACWNEGVYQGKLYGLSYNTDVRGLYYNRDLLKEYGYDRPPENWEELKRYSSTMTEREGKNFYRRVGFAPLWGNSWLYMYGWLNDGRFLSEDGRRCTMNEEPVVEALRWLKECYDAIGGFSNVRGFEEAGGFGGGVDPFITGKVVMIINGNWVLDDIARYKPDLNFGIAGPPPPKGKDSISWSGGFAMAIPAASKHIDEAWELAKWLTLEEGWIYTGRKQKEYNKSIGQDFYIPILSCQRDLNEKMFELFPMPNDNMQEAMNKFLALMEVSKYRPVTPVGRVLWDEQVAAADFALQGLKSPEEALNDSARRVQEELNRIFMPPDYPLLNWTLVSIIGLGLLAAALGYWFYHIAKFWRNTKLYRKEAAAGILFASPWMIGFLWIMLGPMFVSFVFSFCEFDFMHPARYAGLDNYIRMFGFHKVPSVTGGMKWAPKDPYFWKCLWNTLYITVFGVPLSMIIGLSVALLLNLKVKGLSFYRTFFYIPSIVPVMATVLLWGWILHPQIGGLNTLLRPVYNFLDMNAPGWFYDPHLAKPALLMLLLWGSGSTMIIWLAGLKGIPFQLYEAAEIDGAGAIQRFFHVTLPMLTPYIFFNMIMGVIFYIQIFTQAYVLQGDQDSLLVFVFYLFNNAFSYFKMGYASALAWILFLIILILTLIQLRLSRKWVYYEGGGRN